MPWEGQPPNGLCVIKEEEGKKALGERKQFSEMAFENRLK